MMMMLMTKPRTQQRRLTTIMTSTVCINGNANVFVSFITHFSYLHDFRWVAAVPFFVCLCYFLLFVSIMFFQFIRFCRV